MTDTIHYAIDTNQIGTLCINRPDSRNALNWEAQQGFATAVQQISDQPPAVLIITGTGDQAFISGGDLRELDHHKQTGKQLNTVMTNALNRLHQLPCPVIGAINGHAIGGGAEIVTATDLRVMSDQAQIRFVQVRMGLTTGWGGLGRLVPLVGQSHAMELLLAAKPVTAQEALAIGLVHRIAPRGEVLSAAQSWAKELAQLPHAALGPLKSLVYQTSQPDETFKTIEANTFIDIFGNADNQEAVTAFKEKRKPIFNRPNRTTSQSDTNKVA